MAKPATYDGYSDRYTVECERVLVTLLRGNPQSLIATVAEQFGASRCIRPSRRFAVWHMPSIYPLARFTAPCGAVLVVGEVE